MTSTTTTRLAHQVVPYPEPGPHIVRDMARYHAARAWGFWLTAQEPTSPRFAEVVQGLIAEFHLAAVWNHLHYVDRARGDFDAADLAQSIVEDLAAPQVLGPAIRSLCAAVDVDVKEIGPWTTELSPEDIAELNDWTTP